MKFVVLFTAFAALSSVNAIPLQNGKTDWRYILDRRQMSGLIGGLMNAGGGGKVPDPAGAAPRKVAMPPRVPGATTVKMRYGPYNVPNMNKKGMVGEKGSLWNYPDDAIDKPCETCVILGVNAGLEYPDGTNANIDTGMWLHHYVHFVKGQGRVDATCGNRPSAPHMLLGTSSNDAERFFSSGNERTPMFIGEWYKDQKMGYHLNAADKMAFIVDLMNDNEQDKIVYLTVTYDYIDGAGADYDHVKPVWFDVNQCGTSEVPPTSQDGKFTVTAAPWTANFDGDILGYAGHLHDGGQVVRLSTPQGEACPSKATYGANPQYIAKMNMGKMNSATVHISNMTICQGQSLTQKQIKTGTPWTLKADYDYSKNKGVLEEDGKQSSIMGIAIMYVRTPKGQPPALSNGGGAGGLFGGLGAGSGASAGGNSKGLLGGLLSGFINRMSGSS